MVEFWALAELVNLLVVVPAIGLSERPELEKPRASVQRATPPAPTLPGAAGEREERRGFEAARTRGKNTRW